MPRGYDPSQTILPSSPSNIDWSSILNSVGTFGQMLAMSPAYGYLQGADQNTYTPRLGQSAPFPLGDAVYGQNPYYTRDPQGNTYFDPKTFDSGIYSRAPFNPFFGLDSMIFGAPPQSLPYGGGSSGDIST